jgi:hypothetical protein
MHAVSLREHQHTDIINDVINIDMRCPVDRDTQLHAACRNDNDI